MKTLLPINVRAWSDEKNGRWKLTYKGKYAQYGRTSIGYSRAAVECVRQGWDWLDLRGGLAMPETVQAKLNKLSGYNCLRLLPQSVGQMHHVAPLTVYACSSTEYMIVML